MNQENNNNLIATPSDQIVMGEPHLFTPPPPPKLATVNTIQADAKNPTRVIMGYEDPITDPTPTKKGTK